MASNGISTLSTKELKQLGKLDIAQGKRQGKVVATDGTITGSVDTTKEYYRSYNVYDITDLPTRYEGNDIFDNPNTGGLSATRPWRGYAPGVFLQPYSGYFADDPAWFATASTTGSTSTPSTFSSASIPTTTSWQYLGYFRAPADGTYTFYIASDDAGYLWIGDNAVSGFTTGNATASNPGEHGTEEDSGTIAMEAGQLYGFRAQVGNNSGPGEVVISFAGPSITKTSTFSNYVFHNGNTNGF